MQRGLGDHILSCLLLKPHRCRSCANRFYRFRYRWAGLVVPIGLCLLGLGVTTGVYSVRAWIQHRSLRLHQETVIPYQSAR